MFPLNQGAKLVNKQFRRFTFFLLICLTFPWVATAQVVSIPDPNLRAAIAAELGKTSGDTITRSDMAALTWLHAMEANISDLTGLEHAINLTSLGLRDNSVSDITSLSGLTNLTELSLWDNSVSDITSLSGLTNLTWLNLGGNSISDITSLSGLTNLTELFLYDNMISDITSLSGLTNLTILWLWGNTISDITSLSGLTNLIELSFSDNLISDISSLAELTNLTSLSLDRNSISDLSALVANTGLGGGGTLNVKRNPLSSVSIDTHIPILQRRGVTVEFDDIVAGVVEFPDSNLRAAIQGALDIASGDPITTSDMAALTRLDGRRANISDLTGLEHAINLTSLSLWGNSISDISSLAVLTNLASLELAGNMISDITSLLGLTNLTSLNLGGNTISDITSLSGLTNLTGLWLWGNTISDITSLSGLTNLTLLYLQRNSISDLSALVINTGLGSEDTVNVKRNPLSSVSIDTHIPVLQSRGVTVEFDDIVAGVVEFPDSSLRAAIARKLGKALGDPITTSDMTALTQLGANNSNISDLTGLEHAINLTSLSLGGNSISDISSLSGLTNLTSLSLWDNSISDISSLSGLTNLTLLFLDGNSISDLSALVANTGLGGGGTVNVKRNPLSSMSIDTHIPTLQSRGVTVEFDDIVAGVVVEFPGTNLRAVIEKTLGKSSGDTITLSDMERLTQLEANNSNISDLTGLERAINLTWLSLDGNSISDILPLGWLTNLTKLSLDDNSISDISSLGWLTNLIELSLDSNSISNISLLRGLTNLIELSLDSNSISDISPLRELTNLTMLGLRDNSITYISSLSELTNLAMLDLRDNLLTDIAFLSELTNLTELDLGDNAISDISPLRELTNLTELNLGDNAIADLSPLVTNTGLGSGDTVNVQINPLSSVSIDTHIPALQSRGVAVEFDNIVANVVNLPDANLRAAIAAALGKASGTPITTSDMGTLTGFEASNANISDLTGLEYAIKLTWLILDDNSISDISVLSELTKLTSLYLSSNLISDISSLSGLTNLGLLILDDNSISDISSLAGLTNLTWLHLWDNSISDISVLMGLTNLEVLYLRNNSISDLSALVTNTGLGSSDAVNVEGNPLSSVSIDTHIPTLQSRGATVEFDDIVAGVAVDLPDANLRAAIAAELGKTSGDPITTSDMATLTRLNASNSNIIDLTGLENAINLTSLYLGNNSISDISVLAGLINLTSLYLGNNSVSDISAVAGLINLRRLNLDNNSISELSALVTNTGLGNGDTVNVKVNPLSAESINTHIPALQSRGVTVEFDDIVVGVVIDLPDSNLRAAVAAELGKMPADVITTSDMAALSSLSASNSNISDLTGLEHAINLISLNLRNNSISDLSALVTNTGLGNGDRVNVEVNPLSSVSIDTYIPALQSRGVRVDFDDIVPGVVDFPDSNLRAAITAALGKASGDPITTADMATLTYFEAGNANIIDLAGLEHAINLTSLYLGNNSISDLSLLEGLTNLRGLNLSSNLILDISSLGGLTNLRSLSLNSNSISDISSLDGLTNLTELSLRDNSISDLLLLAGLTNLTRLDLGSNLISDISSLGRLTNLTELSLRDNSISDLLSLAGLTNLTRLDLGSNLISDISSLGRLTNLTSLYLGNNSISDISSLDGLTNLTSLSLSDNSISDISSLAGLTNLTELSLWINAILNISPLVSNTGLGSGDAVSMQENPLSYLSIHTHIPTLQSRGVTVGFRDRTPTRLVKISGDNQKGAAFAPLPHPFVVEVQDERGKPFAGVSVVFTVAEGGGTLSVTHTTTDVHGRAESTLTLGPNLGTNTVSVSATEVEGVETFNAISDTLPTDYRLSIPAGISLIHIPLRVTEVDGAAQTIESVADLYDVLGGASTVNFLITYDSQTQEWLSYFVPSDRGTPADAPLADDTGIIAGLRAPVSVQLSGDPLGTDGNSAIALNQGLNLVGLPLRDPRVMRVSDLFALQGIGGNVPVIILTDGGEFKLVGRLDDPGDIEITGGQSFIMTAQREALVEISGGGWYNSSMIAAAPPMVLSGIQVTDTTPVLALRGSIVDEGTGVSKAGLHVKVKNLSTDRAITTVTGDEGNGYQLTVVDIETTRAARIGDILEISAQSPDPFIGVQPLRYTVTVEDVKRGLIRLTELVAYEIPTETELLHNYPNPFNPETWIPYRLAEDAFVTLTIYDQVGHVVRTLEVGHQIASAYENRSKAVYWDGRNEFGEGVVSGVYFYHLSAGDYSATRKMVILK